MKSWFSATPLALAALVGASVCLTTAANAAENGTSSDGDVPFGSKGQWVVSGGTQSLFNAIGFGKNGALQQLNASGTFERFVAKNISLGAGLSVGYFRDEQGPGTGVSVAETTSINLNARLGVNIPLTERLSLYPRFVLGAGMDFNRTTFVSSGSAPYIESGSPTTLSASVDLPLIFRPAANLFIGVGPLLNANTAPGGTIVALEPEFLLGGTFGGGGRSAAPKEGASSRPDDGGERTPEHRFGERGELVLMNRAMVGGELDKRDGVTAVNLSLSPSFNYFVANHVSLGMSADIGFSSSSGNGEPTYSTVTLGATAQLGVAVPLNHRFSLYPLASIGATRFLSGSPAGQAPSNGQTVPAPAYFGAATETIAKLFVPVLAHVTEHVFVGLGPEVTRVLTYSIDGGPKQPGETAAGIEFVLGGWI